MNQKFRLVKSYSSLIIFSAPNKVGDITDLQLVWMAKTAFGQMIDSYLNIERLEESLAPGAMVLLAPPAGNKIYLASSIRHFAGRQSYTQSPVKLYLEQCVHRTDGRCAEFNVVEAYFEDNPSAEKCSLEGSKIVSWVRPTRGSTSV